MNYKPILIDMRKIFDETYQTNIYRKIVYAPPLFFTLIGLALSFKLKERRRFLLLYFLFISFTVGYSIFFFAPRYRVQTIQPYMIIFASYAVYYMFTRYGERLKARIEDFLSME